MLGTPTGIGVLYGKAAILENMSPFQGGGSMISNVHSTKNKNMQYSISGLPGKLRRVHLTPLGL